KAVPTFASVEVPVMATLRGRILWLDFPDLVRSREVGTITRAIVRETELVMDVEALGDVYAVTLKKVGDSRYRGEWIRMSGKGPRRGRALADLTSKGEYLDVCGDWEEDGSWSWFSRLQYAETSLAREEADVRPL